MDQGHAATVGAARYAGAAHWPRATEEGAKPLHDATKHIASRTRPTPEWSSGDLVETLMRHALVDEYRRWMFPPVIGTYEPAGEIVIGSFALD